MMLQGKSSSGRSSTAMPFRQIRLTRRPLLPGERIHQQKSPDPHPGQSYRCSTRTSALIVAKRHVVRERYFEPVEVLSLFMLPDLRETERKQSIISVAKYRTGNISN